MEEKLPRKIKKPWGFELIVAHTPAYAGKLLFVKKGHRLSLQYHKKKDESFYIHKGEAFIEIDYGIGQQIQIIGKPGDCFHIPPLTRHRLEAVEDTTLFEVSTPELEDIERLEDDYGR